MIKKMKDFDKFGHPIYEKTWRILLRQGRALLKCGYKESEKKPNLFYRVIKEGVFFADMRSSNIVPIWEDTDALFYWNIFDEALPVWEKRKIINDEMDVITMAGCPCRLSEEQIDLDLNGGEGECVVCGVKFNHDGLFCSDSCKAASAELYKTRCARCGKRLDFKTAIRHHLSYDPEKTIEVCRSCHLKIHRSKEGSRLRPDPLKERGKIKEKER